MNAANEIAVAAFLYRQMRFPDIWQTVEKVMERHTTVAHPDLDAILAGRSMGARGSARLRKSVNR